MIIIPTRCWQGLKGQRPDDENEISKFTRWVEEEGRTIVATQLPDRTWSSDEERSRGVSTYACNFGFQQAWGSGDPFIDSIYEDAYIVQGNDENPPISVSISSANLPNEDALQQAASRTVEDNTPFENFPDGTDGRIKDPLIVWNREFG